jgi:hypothetical protein
MLPVTRIKCYENLCGKDVRHLSCLIIYDKDRNCNEMTKLGRKIAFIVARGNRFVSGLDLSITRCDKHDALDDSCCREYYLIIKIQGVVVYKKYIDSTYYPISGNDFTGFIKGLTTPEQQEWIISVINKEYERVVAIERDKFLKNELEERKRTGGNNLNEELKKEKMRKKVSSFFNVIKL